MRTIQRDLLALQSDLLVPLTEDGSHRYGIMEGYTLPPISFSLYEAVCIFLVSRLVLRQTDECNPHLQSVLSRLCHVLPPGIAVSVEESIRALSEKSPDPHYLRVFETMAVAWATRRRLKLRYLSLASAEPKEWVFDPYFLEMTGVGYSAYAIGHGVHGERRGIVTLKLDRIREAEPMEETFEVPQGLNLGEMLRGSWGVMGGEEVVVQLRFSAAVARRVKESVWHPSQVIEDADGGGCVMTVKVSNVLEMTPWIRGWGPEVEVLAPASLREEFRGWAARLGEMYGTVPAALANKVGGRAWLEEQGGT